jgi:hypothetical protein
MKKIVLFVLVVLLASACKNTWSQEDKDAFYQACTEEATKTGDTPDKAKAYCDCVFGKMEAKYPHEEDALEHIDKLANDTDLIKCKVEVK